MPSVAPTQRPPAAHAALLLLERAACRDRVALEAMAREVQPLLRTQARGLARRALGRGPSGGCDLDDLVADVVAEVQAFLAAGEPDGPGWRRYVSAQGTTLEGWLFGIVRNKLRRRLRDVRRHAALLGVVSPTHSEVATPERALDGARALALARSLPARERDALALWLADAPTSEIAERLCFASPHAVDCCLSRGKQRLRAMMDDPVAVARAA